MKRVLSLIIVFSLFIFAANVTAEGLGAGYYDPASAGRTELSFSWWGNDVRDAVTLDALALFTENYPNVTFDSSCGNWNDYWVLMHAKAEQDDLPDLMQQDYSCLEQWAAAGDLLDLTPYVESGALDLSHIPQNLIDVGKVGEGLYGVCAGVNSPALIYNKSLTDELGIQLPMDLDWDEFVSVSRQIYEAKGGYGVVYGQGRSENPLTCFARSLGHNALFEEEGSSLTAGEAALYYQTILDGVSEGWMFNAEQLASVNVDDVAQSPLVFGNAPELRSWCFLAFSNQLAAFQKAAQADGIELGIAAWPSNDLTSSNYIKPSHFFSVTSDSENPDLAVAVLNYLINDIQANIRLQAERGIPASMEVAAAIEEEIIKIEPTYGISLEYLDYVEKNSSPIYPPLPAYAGRVNEEVISRLSDEILQDPAISAEQAGAEFVESVRAIAADEIK